jgi:NAD(P)-dependent dehydrogenase (short-subunit alcohol dehydrogenase family)
MPEHPLSLAGKNILITGAARRLGRQMALSIAQAGGNVIIHHGHSAAEAERTLEEIKSYGVEALIIKADLSEPDQVQRIFPKANLFGQLYALVNNAALFTPLSFHETSLVDWQEQMSINLTAPFLLSQAFAASLQPDKKGRIVNILDWRALRPGADHFPYTISKAALAAMTRSLAISLAPNITVNGLALGAILPPSDYSTDAGLLKSVPAARWASIDEVCQSLLFLLTGPEYITGEIIHVDGGRHLT